MPPPRTRRPGRSAPASLRRRACSALRAGGRGTRLVAASGSFSSARPRWATRAWPTAPLARDPLTDTTGNRRPKSGCPGSVTSISTKSPSSGFWKGVPTDVLVRRGQPGMAGPLPGAPDRRPAHRPPDPEMAEGGRPRGRGRDGQRQGDRAGVGDLAAPRQPLPAPRLRPLGRALATARGHGRHDPRPLRGRHRGRLRARGRRPALPGRDARAAGGVRAVAASGQDPPDRVRPSRGGPTRSRGLGKPETFAFLGFTFICGTARRGGFQVQRKSRRDRVRARLGAIKEELRRRRHQPIPVQGLWLRRVVTGFFAYHGVPTNGRALAAFRFHVLDLWRRTLRRRSQRDRPHVGTGGEAGRPLAPQAQDPPPLAAAALRRQAPEVGAVCGKPARTVLCGGRPVMGVPTAIPPVFRWLPAGATLGRGRRQFTSTVVTRNIGG